MFTPPVRPSIQKSQAEKAAVRLGLNPYNVYALTVEEVRSAFRAVVREVHPDTGYGVGPVAAQLIQEAKEAKAVLEQWIDEG